MRYDKPMSDAKPDDLICVGAIAGAFGVRGEARIKSFCAAAEDIARYAPLCTEDGAKNFTIKITRPVKGGLAARLGGVATREAAEALKGVRLFAPRDRMPPLPDDEYYYADLVGLAVFDPGGAEIGAVRAVAEYGAGDFLEIRRTGGKTLLIPITQEAAPLVDIAAGRIVVDPPEDVEEEPSRP